MFVMKKAHDALIREKDDVISGLNTRLSSQSDKIAELEAQLAPFKRTRGAGGRFVKS